MKKIKVFIVIIISITTLTYSFKDNSNNMKITAKKSKDYSIIFQSEYICLSLKQTSLPREVDEKLDGIEIDYDTLVGKNKSIYTQLLINNLISHKVEIDKKNLTKYLYAHVNRGVNIIYTNKLKDISGLMNLTKNQARID